MAIVHRYENELVVLEQEHHFCGVPVQGHYNLLIIGTFNPNDDSCIKRNTATWFYGRKQSKFWRYLPQAMGNDSLHESDGDFNLPNDWKQYCVDNRIIIIDLLKRIESNNQLQNFGDRAVNAMINNQLNNVASFNVQAAFSDVTFDKVIYSLKWSDTTVGNLKGIRNDINQSLIDTGCINGLNQVKYPKTPSRNDSLQSWCDAIAG